MMALADADTSRRVGHRPRTAIQREMGLAGRDPTGFLVRYLGCPLDNDAQVVLEVCPTYHNGEFGGTCSPRLANHFDWVKFHHNTILLRMLHDFCKVCEDSCPPDVYRTTPHKERQYNFPDICNAIYAYDLDGAETCDAVCLGHHESYSAMFASCQAQVEFGFGGGSHHSNCSETPPRELELGGGPDDDNVPCVLDLWWMEWTDSIDEPGYPTFMDEITHEHGHAFLQCSFQQQSTTDKEPDGLASHCREFYQRLELCVDEEDHSERWRDDATPSPTAARCRSSPTTASSKKNIQPTMAHSLVEATVQAPTRVSASNGITSAAALVAGCVAVTVALLLVVVSWNRRRPRPPQWAPVRKCSIWDQNCQQSSQTSLSTTTWWK